MAKNPLGIARPVTCYQWAKTHPWAPVSGLLVGLMFVPWVIWEVEKYIDHIRPDTPVIKDITTFDRDANGSVRVEAHVSSAAIKECVRISTAQFVRGMAMPFGTEIQFLNFGGAISGTGYKVRALTDYTLVYLFPSSVASGNYTYVYRAYYQCGPLNLIPFTTEITGDIVIP